MKEFYKGNSNINGENVLFQSEQQPNKMNHILTEQEILSCFYEGECYYYGKDNHPVNKKTAILFYEKAAENGYSVAQLMCGYMYDFGDGIDANPSLAIRYYTAAAKQNDSNATLNLANIYLLGRGVPKNVGLAIGWLQKAADLDNAVACSSLGRQYTLGEGVEKSVSKADYWITKAENNGYVNCETMINLGLMYEEAGNETKAFRCFEKALNADTGNLDIQYLYGQYKFYGRGTNRDLKEALLHVQWVVDQDPSDREAYELLTKIRLYEQINSALDVIRNTVSDKCYVWDFYLNIIAVDWGFYIIVKYSDSEVRSFKNTSAWQHFSELFTFYKNDMVTANTEGAYRAVLHHKSSEIENLNILDGIIYMISKDFDFKPFIKSKNYYTLQW